jgi:hypothetical protein
MSELGDKRKFFTRCVSYILIAMLEDGYEPMIGRDGEKHMKNSLHYDGLAVDITLTKDNVILDKTLDHEKYGKLWESYGKDCYWGGPGDKKDGLSNDGNHYSVTYQGKK